MTLSLIASSCGPSDDCPAVREVEPSDEDVFVQGYEVTDPALLSELSPPPGEAVVRIPRSLLLAAAARVSQTEVVPR